MLAIIGALAGVVVLNFVGADRERELQTEAERLAALVELARNESLARNEAWGVFVSAESYAFAAYDAAADRWRRRETGPLRKRAAPPGISFHATIERLKPSAPAPATTSGSKRQRSAPSILIFASGEQTPFSIQVIPEWEAAPWIVQSDGIQRTRAMR